MASSILASLSEPGGNHPELSAGGPLLPHLLSVWDTPIFNDLGRRRRRVVLAQNQNGTDSHGLSRIGAGHVLTGQFVRATRCSA